MDQSKIYMKLRGEKRKFDDTWIIKKKQKRDEKRKHELRKWINNETRLKWRRRNVLILKSNCIKIIVRCDFCFRYCGQYGAHYMMRDSHPDNKLDIWIHHVVADGIKSHCMEMVRCFGCQYPHILYRSQIVEREKKLMLCYLDVGFKFK